MSIVRKIADFGQQVWLDALSRELIRSGQLARWIEEDGVCGITTNPAILQHALQRDISYRPAYRQINASTPEAVFEALVLPDIRSACDLLRPTYERTAGESGYVSFEVAPHYAHDAKATVREARRLWAAIDRPNAMIKIPATDAGVGAISQVLAEGINVNATLIFSRRQAQAVFRAYVKGVMQRLAKGGRVERLRAVISVFISRIDTAVDDLLAVTDPARGTTAIALAKVFYSDWREHFSPMRNFQRLAAEGAQPPLLLWASTGTKNPTYSDVLYVSSLIGTRTVNTVPVATLDAFRDHGAVAATLTENLDNAASHVNKIVDDRLVDLDKLGEQLQQAGLAQFLSAYNMILETVRSSNEVADAVASRG